MLVLEKHLEGGLPGSCVARWIERHESALEFRSFLGNIAQAFLEISLWKDALASSNAKCFCRQLKTQIF